MCVDMHVLTIFYICMCIDMHVFTFFIYACIYACVYICMYAFSYLCTNLNINYIHRFWHLCSAMHQHTKTHRGVLVFVEWRGGGAGSGKNRMSSTIFARITDEFIIILSVTSNNKRRLLFRRRLQTGHRRRTEWPPSLWTRSHYFACLLSKHCDRTEPTNHLITVCTPVAGETGKAYADASENRSK